MKKKRAKQPTATTATNKRIIVPKFAAEAEEADWSYRNRKTHSEEFLKAARRGEVQVLTKEKLLARSEASKNKAVAAPMLSVRIPDDLALARRQAEKKGLPYQT